MNFFSGSQLAVAIEDLANQQLLESEEILAERIIQEITSALPLRAEDIPKKLINGFMRGSTSFKVDQLAGELTLLERKLGITLGDFNDALSIVTHIKFSLERERKDIHIKRTQKSAIKQVLRYLKEDLEQTSQMRSFDLETFITNQNELLEQDFSEIMEIQSWAAHVLQMFHGVYVDFDEQDSSLSSRPKNKISQAAAINYTNAWFRFIEANSRQLFELAQQSKPLPQHFSSDTNFQVSSKKLINSSINLSSRQSIRVLIENTGSGAIKFEKTWASKSDARKELKAFLSLLSTLVDSKERIDLFEVSIESTNGISLILQEVFQSKIEETLSHLLTD